MNLATELPIDAVLPQLLAALQEHSSVVLRAPAGAGKTTRVPPAVFDAAPKDGRVLVLQPRRVAARAAARRIAQERRQNLGGEVGYHVRFDRRAGRETRILVMTEGILLRMLQDDPFLESTGTIVFDEFHERRVDSEIALGMVRRVQEEFRPELKIVVMSATLAAEPIAAYLNDCPLVESSGRTHPVQIEYQPPTARGRLAEYVAEAVRQVYQRTNGDVLVFLPGVGEIRQVERQLAYALRGDTSVAIMQLHGSLSPEEQDAVLNPSQRRKVVLATNVAETSLTIEGVTAVVDSGLARILRFEPRTGMDRLELTPISQASADQRAGRAGRTQAGLCVRLWDARSHRARPEFDEPEVRRIDLAGPLLQLLCWGEQNVESFSWFEKPRSESVEQALQLLHRLDALHEHHVTELGRQLVRLPIPPRLGRLLLEGAALGCANRAALAAALLSERDPFQPTDSRSIRGVPTQVTRHSNSDIADRVGALEQFEKTGTRDTPFGSIRPAAARGLFRIRDQLLRTLRDAELQRFDESYAGDGPSEEPQLRALLAAYPDRLARRRAPNSDRGVMVGGRGVRLHAQSAVRDEPLFLCVDVDAGRTDALVRQASAVKREWLPVEHLRTTDEMFFHPSQKRVAARRRTYWEDLLLDEVPVAVSDDEQAAELLYRAALAEWQKVFPDDNGELQSLLARIRCLAQWMPELNLPTLDDKQLHQILRTLCFGSRSFEDLRKADWSSYLRATLTPAQQAALERDAPARITVPSGSRIAVEYHAGKPPVLAVRIQEVFGLRETPRVAGGRVPVLMHLLAPNMRAQQITDDLASFWTNTYEQVRKELRRRYPKHAWPEDPLRAEPERRPSRKR